MTRLANAMTYYRARAMAQGFKFSPIVIEEARFNPGEYVLRGDFECVCGRLERFQFMLSDEMPEDYLRNELDIVRWLTLKTKSFSREHLLDDGYTEDQVLDIERRGEAFDMTVPAAQDLIPAGLRRYYEATVLNNRMYKPGV